MNPTLIFVGSPYRATESHTLTENVTYACDAAKHVARVGIHRTQVPLVPHILFTRFLDDSIKQEREKGMSLALAMLRRCDEAWFFTDHGVSQGMADEIEAASAAGIPIRMCVLPTGVR